MENYIFSIFENRKDIRMIKIERPRLSGIKKLKYLIFRHIRSFMFNRKNFAINTLYTKDFLDKIRQIGPEDSVLLFSKNLKDILILNKELEPKKFNVCIWDSLCTKSRSRRLQYSYRIHKDKIALYTIDKEDAKNYNFRYVNQFYRDYDGNIEELIDPALKTDMFFIGQDKNRANKILELLNEAEKQQLNPAFFILKGKHTTHNERLEKCYIEKNVPYNEVLRYIANSKCLVEILQEGQTGMTLRAIEALFFKKKLITNNKYIANEPFYHRNNVYILGDDKERRSLKEFIESESQEIGDDIIDIYRVETFMKQFR